MIVVLVRCLRNSAGWGAEEPSHLPPGSGPGIRMNLAKLGSSNGIEVVDSNNRHLALPSVRGSRELDTEPPKCRMHPFQPQSETLRMSQPAMAEGRAVANAVAQGVSTYHFSNSQEAAARTSLADLTFSSHSQEAMPMQSAQSHTTNESGSTSTASAKRSTPAMIQRNGSNNDLGTPSTPALQAGGAFCGGTFMGQRISSPSGTSMGQATPMQYGVTGPAGSDRRSSSESNTASYTETAGRRWSPSSPNGQHRASADSAETGGFVFSMFEENDLISPQVSRLHGRTIPEEKQSTFDLDGRKAKNGSNKEAWAPGSAQTMQRRVSEDQCAPLPPAASKATSKRPQTIRKSPLLWTEDEIAAFMGCLGLSTDICQRVMGRKIKGASQLLSMTDAQLRKYLGLVTPVERLVVRHALKRLLDAARWENNVCGHKGMDILSDSVLSHYLVPKEELTLVSRISQGGYGTVYRGVLEPKVDRAGGTFQARRTHLVAVKDMKGERRVQLYELLKEACVMASLSHPNICTFVGVSMDPEKKRHYIISELMDCSLFDMIHQPYKLRWHGELTVALSLSLGTGIISGICYIHQKNLVHADLKSSNILIDYTSSSRHPVPRICDFGHAAVRCHPSPHHRCGTPHWASPEVLRSEALGPAADIYSFGVMLWEMLTQKLPHKDMSFGQVLASVGWAGSTPDMAQLPDLPKEVSRIIKDRLRGVAEMVVDLNKVAMLSCCMGLHPTSH
ncbi:unnamed protein product [Symbiodinium natans]|uniref:Protein kinase domain-containing protein n=1 Tax=Symbiodinium natans TaxID=878477 RepID=A0A812I4Q8_9DINO|nr:unnamed protein product [Symbiodinium natans]